MLKRRKIGPAYERSPIKKLSEWSNNNLLILGSALLLGVVFWFGVDLVVDGFLNFLATSGDEAKEKPFSSNDTMWILVKIFGSLGVCTFVAKSAKK